MFRRMGIFHRFFVSYMLITLIPVCVLFAVLYKNNVVNLRNEVESFNMSSMHKVRDIMDSRIREWKSISTLIASNPKLSPFSMTKGDYFTMEGIDELAKYKAGNAFINDILLWYKNDSARLFSSSGTISRDVLLEWSYGFGEADRKQFAVDIESLKVPVMKQFDSSDTMTYMVPLSVFGGVHYGTAIFTFQGATIRNMISQGRTEIQGATLLLDVNQNEIFHIDKQGILEEEGLLPFVKEKVQPGIHTFNFRKKSMSIISVTSEETGWTYVTVIPTKQFQERVTSEEIFIIVCTLIVLLLCAAAALTLALRSYRPIRLLSSFVKHHQLAVNEDTGNEFDSIGRAFGQAVALNHTLSDQLDTQRMLLRHEVLIQLLKGETGNREARLRLLESCDMKLPGPIYAVLLVYYDPGEADVAKLNGKLLDYISRVYSQQGFAYAVEPGDGNAIAIIANIENEAESAGLVRLSEDVLQVYTEPYRSKVTIGIGRLCNDLFRIDRAYIQAYASVEQRALMPGRQLIRFEEIVTLPQLYWQSVEDEMYWIHSLKQGDRTLAYESLKRMLKAIRAKNMPEPIIRFNCNKLADLAIQTVQQVMREYAASSQDELGLGDAIMNIIHFTSLSEFERQMHPLIDGICDYIEKIREQREQGLVTQVIRYLEENFKDSRLSLDTIAEQFGYSNYYWSRFFKEKTGLHFTDYLWRLRAEEAKRQMVETKKKLKDIILDIGYLDLSSFSRRFKGELGITPGQYRTLYAEDKEME